MPEDPDFIALARKRFEEACADEKAIREEAAADLRFVAGDQWDERVKLQRIQNGRPALTFNRSHTFVQQVANEARQMRGEIKYVPAEDGDQDTAEVYEGLARHIQYNSKARIAYETAVDYSAGGSFGCYRFLNDYCDDSSFNQEIKVVPVFDPFSVYGVYFPACFGLEPTYAFITQDIPHEEFKRQYPKSALIDMGFDGKNSGGWVGTETVRVAEYWYVEQSPKTIYLLANGKVVEKLPEGEKAKDSRVVNRKVIKFCKINGVEVLPDTQTEWPGKRIPIFPVLGKGIIVDGKPKLFSVVRFQRDPQQLINFYKTRIAETLGTAPIQPYLATSDQIAGHEKDWAALNTKQMPVLLYNAQTVDGKPLGVPQRQVFEPPIASLSEAAAQEIDDMKATAGIYDASLGARSNEQSGTAIQRRQQQSNVTNMHFIDNLERSFDESGTELAAVIPAFYDTAREIRILGNDETPKIVKINQQYTDANQKARHYKLGGDGVGKYDVVVTMGRSFSTKRMESFDLMSQIIGGKPELFMIFGDQFLKNSDMAGADQMAERAKRFIAMAHPGLIDDDGNDPAAQAQRLQAQLSQAKQMIDEQHNVIGQQHQVIETKQVEAQNKLDIEKLKIEGQVTIAEITTKAQETQVRLKLENDMYKQLHGDAHEVALQTHQQQHEAAQAEQAHQQALEQGEQAAVNQSAQSAQDAAQASQTSSGSSNA